VANWRMFCFKHSFTLTGAGGDSNPHLRTDATLVGVRAFLSCTNASVNNN